MFVLLTAVALSADASAGASAGASAVGAAAAAPPVGAAAAPPMIYGLGTQAIYGPDWPMYNFTAQDALTEQRQLMGKMGGNQIKLRLAKTSTCGGYRLQCGPEVVDLASLARQPSVAAAFADPSYAFYQLWLYAFGSSGTFLDRDWTSGSLQAEYDETRAWADHMLAAYSGTGKTFMAGNWEGDWALMGASGCKQGGSFNMTCDPTPAVIKRMVLWGQTRQRAIDDAKAAAVAPAGVGVQLLYYVEFNLGPEAVSGKPGVIRDVLPAVNPDLVSFSSYSSTNDYRTTNDVGATDKAFWAVLDLAQAQLTDKPAVRAALGGLQKRVLIGEFGSHAKTDHDANVVIARVVRAALSWGTPWVLYWEFYDNGCGIPAVVPRSQTANAGQVSSIQHLFRSYYAAADAYAAAHANAHSGARPTATALQRWSASWFTAPKAGACHFEPRIKFPGNGYNVSASNQTQCCDICAADPACAAGVFMDKACYVKFGTGDPTAGDGVACVKVVPT
jgi:hypothetical protein